MHPAQEAWNFACPNEQVLFVELRIKTDVGAIESDHAGALLDVDELFAEPKNDEVLSLDALVEPFLQAHPGKVVGEALGRHAAKLPVDPRLGLHVIDVDGLNVMSALADATVAAYRYRLGRYTQLGCRASLGSAPVGAKHSV